MAIECLQRFVETNCPSACVPVDLVKIARTVAFSNISPRGPADFRFPYDYPDYYYQNPLCLVIDGECCLDRLYGGFFGDWVCGGQWNRMVDFLTTFFQTVSSNNIEITVFLNGASEPHRMETWIEKQKADKEKISQVLRHVTVKGTPPPKVWWIPPSCLRSCLRMVLRHLNINVVLTTNDHHQEVMAYIRKHNYHGLLADDSEYIVFDPPRYFSSVQLKLTFKGCLETKECILNEVTRCLNLHPSRICIVAALLGNHIITDSDLLPFHKSLCPDVKGKIPPNNLIKAVVEFVRNLPSVDDLDAVAQQVFGPNSSEKCEKLKQCVLYYVKGNKNAAARFQSSSSGSHPANITGSHPGNVSITGQQSAANRAQKSPLLPTPGSAGEANALLQNQSTTDSSPKSANNNTTCISSHIKDEDMDSGKEGSKFASETLESERSSLQAYRQVLGKTKHGSAFTILSNQEECDGLASNFSSMGGGDSPMMSNHKDFLQNSVGSDCGEGTSLETPMSQMNLNSKSKSKKSPSKPLLDVPLLPKVPTEVMRMARERHQHGLMSPSIFQVLSQGEIKIPVLFEDEIARELPSPSHLYRPLRQMVYALLFNQHHLQYLAEQKKEKEGVEEKVPEIIIKEWVWSKGNKYNRPDLVPSQHLGWAVPTVTRLWFGSGPEDNKRRLQAFLTCMRSNSPLMCNTSYVPQHYMILCCVLRYIMTNPDTPVLRKHELDAFLVQAVDPHLTDVEHTQKLELPLVTPRGIQLAALFMQGVENALFANDACGAPIPWLMCCPWLFFDGKIFHRKLLKANGAKNLIDLCDNHIDEVAKVERMRAAIMEGVQVQFAHPPLVPVGQRPPPPPPPPFPNFPVPVPGGMTAGRGRGHQRVVPRGGQLEVAGVVVGSWGPNFGQGPRSPTRNIPPQVVSVGGAARGRGGNNVTGVGRGGIPPGRTPILPITKPGGVKVERKKSAKKKNVTGFEQMVIPNLGRGCTIETNSQTIDVNELGDFSA